MCRECYDEHMYYVAVLWFVNQEGQLLLAKRADHKVHDPSLWGPSVTGKLEDGETIEEALLRETQEELGISSVLYKPNLLFEEDFVHPDGATRRFSIYYALTTTSVIEANLDIDKEEVAETKWVSKDEIRELLKSEPGKVVPASAFVLWEKVLKQLEEKVAL